MKIVTIVTRKIRDVMLETPRQGKEVRITRNVYLETTIDDGASVVQSSLMVVSVDTDEDFEKFIVGNEFVTD